MNFGTGGGMKMHHLDYMFLKVVQWFQLFFSFDVASGPLIVHFRR